MHELYCSADERNGYRGQCGGDVGKQFEPELTRISRTVKLNYNGVYQGVGSPASRNS